MKLKTEVFSSYPVVQGNPVDFKKSIFIVDITPRFDENHISFKIEGLVKNENIKNLIKRNVASYYLHCECPATSYRKVFKFQTLPQDITIPAFMIRNYLEFTAFVCLNEDLKGYADTDFLDDFQGITFNLEKGQIICKNNTITVNIDKSGEDVQSWPSVIKIDHLPDANQNLIVNCDTNYITITLDDEAYAIYSHSACSSEVKNILIRLILFPAIMDVIERLKTSDIQDFSDKKWFKVMEKQLHALNLDINNLQDKGSLEVTNLLFKDSLKKSFLEINSIMCGIEGE